MVSLNISLDRLSTDPTGMEAWDSWKQDGSMEAQYKLIEFLALASIGGWQMEVGTVINDKR